MSEPVKQPTSRRKAAKVVSISHEPVRVQISIYTEEEARRRARLHALHERLWNRELAAAQEARGLAQLETLPEPRLLGLRRVTTPVATPIVRVPGRAA